MLAALDDGCASPAELSSAWGATIALYPRPASSDSDRDGLDEWTFPAEFEQPAARKPVDHTLPLNAAYFPTPITLGGSGEFPNHKIYTDYHDALQERSRVYKLDLSNQNMRWGNLCDIGLLSHLEEIDLSGALFHSEPGESAVAATGRGAR